MSTAYEGWSGPLYEFYPGASEADSVWIVRGRNAQKPAGWDAYWGNGLAFQPISDMDMHAQYQDFDNQRVSGHVPLRLRVLQSSYSWNEPYAEAIIIVTYRIINAGIKPVDSAYIGFFFEADHHFIETGKWADPKDIDGTGPDLLALKGHVLTEWDFPAFLEKYPMTNMHNGKPVFNHKEKYAGTPDGTCLYPRGGIKGNPPVKTIFDFKRTANKEKNFLQMAAYARADGLQDTWQMMIIPTGSDTAQGFSKPVISSGIHKFYEVFLDKRKQFLATYGI